MFTVEIDWDETAVTVLDQSGEHEDVQFLLYEDAVYIRQFEDDKHVPQAIAISPQQWEELIASFQSHEGFFKRG